MEVLIPDEPRIPSNNDEAPGDDVAYGRLIAELRKGKEKKYVRFIASALGAIPWIGSLIGAGASLSAEMDQERLNELQRLWVQEHRARVSELGTTLHDIVSRLASFGETLQARIESEEYLALVRRTFVSWDQADTLEKRQMLKRLITNAGGSSLSSDDLVRLFIKWIDQYHEAHFLVVRQIYQHPGVTRGQIWDSIHPGGRPREDSPEADLFRFLIRDLSTGEVIRQQRKTNYYGEFVKKPPSRRGASGSGVMESAFEDTKPYELTRLGREFVHYVMDELAPQVQERV